MKCKNNIIAAWNNSAISWKKNRGSEKYWGDHWNFPEKYIKLFKRYSSMGDIALEIGCGAGRLTIPFSKYFKHTYGIDTSPVALELAEKRRKENRVKNVTFYLGDGYSLKQIKKKSINLVYSCIVFQHLPQFLVYWYLKECFRVLAKNGIAIIDYRDFYQEFNTFKRISGEFVKRQTYDDGLWTRFVTSNMIRRMVEDIGFIIKEERSIDNKNHIVLKK